MKIHFCRKGINKSLSQEERKLNQVEMSNIVLFTLGRLISLLGTFMFSFAIGLYILDITGSGMNFALSLILAALPRVLFSPIAGVLVDRFSRKHIVIITDFLSGIVVILLLLSNFGLLEIYLAIGVLAILNTLFDVAMEASKPNVVRENKLIKVNSYGQMVTSLSSITGPIMGGVLIAFIDIKLFVLINGLSFIISAISEMFINFKFTINKTIVDGEDQAKKQGIKVGFSFIANNKVFKNLIFMSICINFMFYLGVNIPIPYLLNNVLKVHKSIIGFVEAGFPLGFLLGAFLVSIKPPTKIYKSLMRAYFGIALLIICMPIPYLINPSVNVVGYGIYLSAIFFGKGLLIAFIDIPIITLVQKMIPENIRGRVFSVVIMMSRFAIPIATLISGFLVGIISAAHVMIAAGLLLLTLTILYTKKVNIKEIDNYELNEKFEVIEEV